MRLDSTQLSAAGGLASDPLANVSGQTPRARLKSATRNFEALFLSQVFASMRRTVPKGGLLDDSQQEDMFRSMLDQQYALELSRTEGVGLADVLYRRLEKALPPDAELPNGTEKTGAPAANQGEQS